MINTHEGLIEKILLEKISKEELYKKLTEKGYKETEDEMITDFIFAIPDIAAYTYNPTHAWTGKKLTEKRYFRISIKGMT